jgi:hypothetical protein
MAAAGRLYPDLGVTYLLRMLVRVLRQAFTILIVSTYFGATILAAAPMANAAPAPMNGMMHEQGGMGDKKPVSRLAAGCTTEIGCIFLVSLPPPQLTLATMIIWPSVRYSVSREFLDRALDQARSRTSHTTRLT